STGGASQVVGDGRAFPRRRRRVRRRAAERRPGRARLGSPCCCCDRLGAPARSRACGGTELSNAEALAMYTAQGTLDREAAIERYGPMVRRAASQLAAKLPANVELDDLAQAGMIGLFDAMTRFEAGQGAQFETFAMQRVRGAMLD